MAAAAAKKRARGGAFGPPETQENNGEQEQGKFHKTNSALKVAKLGTKTSSDGFARGGATKKAGGGSVDEDGIGREPAHKEDRGRKAGGAITGAASTPSLAKRARGGATKAPFSSARHTSDREKSGKSGHEGE